MWHVTRQEGEDAPLSRWKDRPALSDPSVVPSKSMGGGHFDSSEPSELREGSKQQRADEEHPGSSKLAPKCPCMMVLGRVKSFLSF